MVRSLLIAALLALAVAAPASGAVVLTEIGQFDSPVYAHGPPGDLDRVFVVERGGRIHVVKDGVKLATPFLDVSGNVQAGGEEGLLSVAFHPTDGWIYIYYTVAGGNANRIEAFRASAANPDVADLGTRRTILEIPHPFETNHNGGQLQFGPDGLLWIGTGDGGGGNDQFHQARNMGSLLGKLLRIAPTPGAALPYDIPADNPFTSPTDGARDEIWAFGLRNPWRFSFDRAKKDLTISDVGQGAREEVNFAPASTGWGKGADYGWPCWEGTRHNTDITPMCDPPNAVPPVFDYPRDAGRCSIIGGYVVRDPGLEELAGRYVYGDFCIGPLRSAVLTAPGPVTDDRAEAPTVPTLSSFGEDTCGRVYAASLAGSDPVYRLEDGSPAACVAPPPPPPPPPPGPEQPPPEGGGTTIDDDPPAIAVSRARAQRLLANRSVSIAVRCDEACRVTGTGTVNVPGLARVYRLGRVKATLPAKVRTKLKLRVPKKSLPRIRAALKRGRRVTARVKVIARDPFGNADSSATLIRARR